MHRGRCAAARRKPQHRPAPPAGCNQANDEFATVDVDCVLQSTVTVLNTTGHRASGEQTAQRRLASPHAPIWGGCGFFRSDANTLVGRKIDGNGCLGIWPPRRAAVESSARWARWRELHVFAPPTDCPDLGGGSTVEFAAGNK
jgi:hypothetical protein